MSQQPSLSHSTVLAFVLIALGLVGCSNESEPSVPSVTKDSTSGAVVEGPSGECPDEVKLPENQATQLLLVRGSGLYAPAGGESLGEARCLVDLGGSEEAGAASGLAASRRATDLVWSRDGKVAVSLPSGRVFGLTLPGLDEGLRSFSFADSETGFGIGQSGGLYQLVLSSSRQGGLWEDVSFLSQHDAVAAHPSGTGVVVAGVGLMDSKASAEREQERGLWLAELKEIPPGVSRSPLLAKKIAVLVPGEVVTALSWSKGAARELFFAVETPGGSTVMKARFPLAGVDWKKPTPQLEPVGLATTSPIHKIAESSLLGGGQFLVAESGDCSLGNRSVDLYLMSGTRPEQLPMTPKGGTLLKDLGFAGWTTPTRLLLVEAGEDCSPVATVEVDVASGSAVFPDQVFPLPSGERASAPEAWIPTLRPWAGSSYEDTPPGLAVDLSQTP